MSKLVTLGLLACAVVLGSVDAAQARHHRRSYWGYGCGCGQAAFVPPAPATAYTPPAVPPGPAPAGPTAQANDQAYRSFSAEPAPAPAYGTPAPPASGGFYPATTYQNGSNLNSSQNDPTGGLFTSPTYPAAGGSAENWDTANNHGYPSSPTVYGGSGGFGTQNGSGFNSQNGPGR